MGPGDKFKSQISWIQPHATNGWLALDRNGDGRIDDLSELFGNLTDQPQPPAGQEKNGFLALAVFDKPENGGNNDGWISADDAIFSRLRVWVDANHNGISEPEELKLLSSVGIKAIALNYEQSYRVDKYGNRFRYHAKVVDDTGGDAKQIAWDVILLTKK